MDLAYSCNIEDSATFFGTMDKIPKSPRSNCYFGCTVEGPLHHFPKPYNDTERFEAWKAVLDDDVQELGNMFIYNQLRLCNKHFEHYYISPANRLTRNAVPTLNIGRDTSNRPSVIQIEPVINISAEQDAGNSLKRKFVKDVYNNPEPSTSAELISVSSPTALKGANKRKRKSRTVNTADKRLIQKLNRRIRKLTEKCKTQTKTIKAAKKLSENLSFLKTIEKMPDSAKVLMNMQLKYKNKKRGRKFTTEEKILAASILKQSHKCYNFLRRLIVLPSKRTLQRLLGCLKIKAGINLNIINNLKDTVNSLPKEERLYNLLLDEVALSPGLYFNKREIIGFEDFGEKKTRNIADHALVVMIKSIKTKKKQPILFTFCKSCTKALELKKIILNTVKELQKVGIIIVATICDQAAANVKAIKLLQMDTKTNYLREGKDYNSNAFEVNDLKIFPLFDTPHLLKGVRNNFITKNIKYKHEGKTKLAKWEHLRILLNEDTGEDEIRIVNKLTEYHVDPEKIPKMKVKYAAQVFSRRVSAVMRFLSRRNIIPAECVDTADLLLIFDNLFDSFNGHSYSDTVKVLKGCLKNNSPHIQFWMETLPILKTIEFEKIVKNRDGTTTIKYEKVPSIQNWIHNINTFTEMWKYISLKYKIKNLLTRNFNQDPLENFFCCIRSNGIRNVNPTCVQFINAYKTLLINNMNSNHSINANCEKDDYQSLQSMKNLLTNGNKYDSLEAPDFACEIDYLIATMNEIITRDNILHEQAKKYVAGYVVKKCKTKICKSCQTCMSDLLKSEIERDSFNYMIDYTKKSLLNASDNLIKLLNDIYFMIVTCLRDSPENEILKDKMVFFINCRCDFSFMTCNKHKLQIVDYLINLSISLIVNSWCTNVNRILNGKIVHFDHNDSVKLQAFNYNKIHKKRK